MSTDIAFHFGAPDRLAYACRLLRKATASGARLLVRAGAQERGALDAALWNLAPTEFITHCDTQAPEAVRRRSAVLLQDAQEPLQDASFPVLVNLADDLPAGFEQFQRVIEIVSLDGPDRVPARQRWRAYTERGYAITRHDLKLRTSEGS